MHIHIFMDLHTHRHREHSSEEFDSSRLSAFADRDTSTSQDSPPNDRRLYGTSQITVTLLRQLLTFQSPVSSSPTSQASGSRNMFQSSKALPIHINTHTYTPWQCLLTNFKKKGNITFCGHAMLKWDTVRIWVHVTSMWVFYHYLILGHSSTVHPAGIPSDALFPVLVQWRGSTAQ